MTLKTRSGAVYLIVRREPDKNEDHTVDHFVEWGKALRAEGFQAEVVGISTDVASIEQIMRRRAKERAMYGLL